MALAAASTRPQLLTRSRAGGRPSRPQCVRQCRSVVVRAAAEPQQQQQEAQQQQQLVQPGQQQQQQQGLALSLREGWQRFMERYEHNMLSAGVGALVVTTYCVSRGQDPATAAQITIWATVVALVANEVLFAAPAPPAE